MPDATWYRNRKTTSGRETTTTGLTETANLTASELAGQQSEGHFGLFGTKSLMRDGT